MNDQVRSVYPLLRLTVIGGVITALALGALGVVLVMRSGPADTAIDIVGWTIKSSNAGVIAIFLAVVVLVLVVRRALRTAETALEHQPVQGVRVGDRLKVEDAEIADIAGVVAKGQTAGDVRVLNDATIKGAKVGNIAGVKINGDDRPKQ